jgi:hypothetical protein
MIILRGINKIYWCELFKRIFNIVLLTLIPVVPALSQENYRDRFVQVSGIVLDENLYPVSGVTVISQKLRRAAVSEPTGIYSLTSTPGDTIMFRAVGYKRYHSIIPEDFPDRSCTVDIVLEPDTIMIEEVTILPWRTYNEFIADVIKEKEEDPVITYMNDNIESIYVAIMRSGDPTYISPQNSYRTSMQQNYDMMRNRNQLPTSGLFNPLAWPKFFNAVKNGLLRNESSSVPRPAKVIEPKKSKTRGRKNNSSKD